MRITIKIRSQGSLQRMLCACFVCGCTTSAGPSDITGDADIRPPDTTAMVDATGDADVEPAASLDTEGGTDGMEVIDAAFPTAPKLIGGERPCD